MENVLFSKGIEPVSHAVSLPMLVISRGGGAWSEGVFFIPNTQFLACPVKRPELLTCHGLFGCLCL